MKRKIGNNEKNKKEWEERKGKRGKNGKMVNGFRKEKDGERKWSGERKRGREKR